MNSWSLNDFVWAFKGLRWRAWLLVALSAALAIGWRMIRPVPAEASLSIPVVIRGSQHNHHWDELKVDAFYHALFQIIEEQRPSLSPASSAWLELTNETYRLVVRNVDGDQAAADVRLWAAGAYQHLTKGSVNQLPGIDGEAPGDCISGAAAETGYTCLLPDSLAASEEGGSAESQFAMLWVGEPEKFQQEIPPLFLNLLAAGLSGGLMGMILAAFAAFVRLSETMRKHEA
ncbi:MAG: hypothetical protein HPY85_01815 [Anaerolineae bacterium]|nr:hypothetical protein [Anaerolineae bacterium]